MHNHVGLMNEIILPLQTQLDLLTKQSFHIVMLHVNRLNSENAKRNACIVFVFRNLEYIVFISIARSIFSVFLCNSIALTC